MSHVSLQRFTDVMGRTLALPRMVHGNTREPGMWLTVHAYESMCRHLMEVASDSGCLRGRATLLSVCRVGGEICNVVADYRHEEGSFTNIGVLSQEYYTPVRVTKPETWDLYACEI